MAKKKAESALPSLPAGWAWVDMARKPETGERAGEHYYAGNTKSGTFEVPGPIWVAVPIELEAMQEALADYSTTFDGQDGEIKVDGVVGLAGRGYYSGYESERNGFAKRAGKGETLTREIIQAELNGVRPFVGRKAGPKVSDEETKDMDKDQILALLRARGLLG